MGVNNNTQALAITSGGNVGIGTTNPSYKLHVVGTIGSTDVQITGNPTSDTSAVTRQYINSQGENLITNGSGLMGNNYNFSSFNFYANETHGGAGSVGTSSSVTAFSDEYLPVDPIKTYRLVLWAKAGDVGGSNFSVGNTQYAGVAPYDIDKNTITPYHYMKYTGATDTTLAQALNVGDSQVVLTDATGWNNAGAYYQRHLIWFGYANSKGYTYPDYTYTRYGSYNNSGVGTSGTWNTGGISGNTITLISPWTGPALATGTAVRNSSSGGGYKYIAMSNINVPNTWTRYEGSISGTDTAGTGNNNQFPYGTAYTKLLFLSNYSPTTGNIIRYSDIWFSEMSAYNLEIATATTYGVMSTGTQTFAGAKTFSNNLSIGGTLSLTGTPVSIGSTILYINSSNQVTKGLLDATNGLNFTSGNFGLGGTLTQNTFLNTNTNNLYIMGVNNNTQALAITSGGNVGIGTTNPGTKLHISGGGINIYNQNYTGTNRGLTVAGYQTSNTSTDPLVLITNNWEKTITSPVIFQAKAYDDTSGGFVIKGSGNVGIGTTSPLYPLHVSGAGVFTKLGIGATHSTYNLFVNSGGIGVTGDSTFANNVGIGGTTTLTGLAIGTTGTGTTAVFVDSSGNLYKNKLGALAFLDNTIGTYTWIANTGTTNVTVGTGTTLSFTGTNGLYALNVGNTFNFGLGGTLTQNTFLNTNTNNLYIMGVNNNTQALAITSGGNIGIGTTTPNYKLEVRGNDAAGTTTGDFMVDTANKKVLIGRLSSTAGDQGSFEVRNRLGTKFIDANMVSNYMALGEGSTGEVLRITSGNIGIGTTNPGGKLHLYDTTAANDKPQLILQNYAAGRYLSSILFKGDDGSGGASDYNVSKIVGGFEGGANWTDTTLGFETYNGASFNRIMTMKNGNVGIGTTNPQSPLHVGTTNTSEVSGQFIGHLLASKVVDIGDTRYYLDSNNNTSNTTSSLSLTQTGSIRFNVGDSNPSPVHIGSSAASQIRSFTNGLLLATSTSITGVITGWDNQLFLNSTGRVGIGTTGPSYKLDVVGDGYFSTNLTVGGTLSLTGTPVSIGSTILYINSSNQVTKGLLGATNGLNFTSGNFGLGGTLAQNTFINTSTNNLYIMGVNNNTQALAITTAGNVGIGQTNPGSKLSVLGSVAIGATYSAYSAPTSSLIVEDKVGIGTSSPGTQLDILGSLRLGNGTANLSNLGDILTLNKFISADTAPSWSTGTAGGTGRYSHSSVLYNGKIYSWGGVNGIVNLNTMDIYDISSDTWSLGATGGTARQGHSSILYNGKIYSWGGWNSGYLNTMDIYDIASNTWSVGTSGGNNRYEHSSVLYNGKIYSWGGYNGLGYLNTIDIYDIGTTTWSTGTAGGTGRYEHSSVLYNGKIYSWGGVNGSYLNTVDIYDIASNTWSIGTSGGSAEEGHSSVLYNGKIYSWGGFTGSGYSSTVDIYDIASNTWSVGTSGGTAKYRHTSVTYNGKIYSWGGWNGGTINTVDIYNLGDRQNLLTLQENGQDSLIFETNSTLFTNSGRFNIIGGNVGIGFSNPSNRLVIGSDLTGASFNPAYTLAIGAGDTASDATLQLGESPNDKGYLKWIGATNKFYISTANTAPVILQNSGGNVGIGTTNPQEKLHVFNSTGKHRLLVGDGDIGSLDLLGYKTGSNGYNDVGSNAYFSDSNVWTRRGAGDAWLISQNNNTTGGSWSVLYAPNNSAGTTIPTWSTFLSIGSSGTIGIGNTTTNRKLDIFQSQDDVNGGLGIANSSIGSRLNLFLDSSNNAHIYSGGTGNNKLILNATGNVGIGTTNPGYKLQVGTAGDGTEARANAWNTLSDNRLKTNLTPLSDPLSLINSIHAYHFNWNIGTDTRRQFGTLAQEVETVLPEVVSTDQAGFKSLDYSKLSILAISGIQQQQQQINGLIASLKDGIINTVKLATNNIETQTITPLSNIGIGSTLKIDGDTEVAGSLFAQNIKTPSINVDHLDSLTSNIQHLTSEDIGVTTLTALNIQSSSITSDSLESHKSYFTNLTSESATVSGTLYADQIISREGNFGDLMTQKIATLRDEVKNIIAAGSTVPDTGLLSQSTDWMSDIGSSSIELSGQIKLTDNLIVAGQLAVSGQTNLAQTLISGGLSVDQIKITASSIETLASTLYLQPSKTGTVDIMAGTLIVADNGDVTINGNLTLNGTLTAQSGSFTGNLSAYLLTASDIQTTSISTQKLNIISNVAIAQPNPPESVSPSATKSAHISSNATAGTSTLITGQTEITLYTNQLTPTSMVYLTPVGSTQNQVLYLKDKFISQSPEDCSLITDHCSRFVIAIDSPLDHDIQVNWWIIN
jgi:hypothetical protein